MKVYGVIMAGGGGTRFWPLSRQKRPKQLLNLTGKMPMINEAVERLSYIIEAENIFIVTNQEQAASMLDVTKGLVLPEHILLEPCVRNTAACIGYAALEITKKYGDGVMVITPSDHYIRNTDKFAEILKQGIQAADESGKLVTIGIKPTFPATGYGYIKYEKEGNEIAKPVVSFKEKPDEQTAKGYIESEEYLWNSGMFLWKASVILEKMKEHIPDIYRELLKIGDSMNTSAEKECIESVYPNLRKISIDYGVMEPASLKGEVLTIPGDFGWDDVGSWDMMKVLHDSDEAGNVFLGDVVGVDVSNTIAYSSGRTVAALGVDNLIIVETPDAVMVCPKDRAQEVGRMAEHLISMEHKELI